jgi:hypothetical protein
VRFECEVTGVKKLHLRVRIIPCEGLSPGRHKEGIVLAPDRERGRPVSTEILFLYLDRP